MARPARLLAFLLCLSALAPNGRAQQATGPQKKTAPKKTTAEADPLAEVRRSTAISLVNARADFDRAAALARTIKGESPRSVATLAVARSVLVKRPERAAN